MAHAGGVTCAEVGHHLVEVVRSGGTARGHGGTGKGQPIRRYRLDVSEARRTGGVMMSSMLTHRR